MSDSSRGEEAVDDMSTSIQRNVRYVKLDEIWYNRMSEAVAVLCFERFLYPTRARKSIEPEPFDVVVKGLIGVVVWPAEIAMMRGKAGWTGRG